MISKNGLREELKKEKEGDRGKELEEIMVLKYKRLFKQNILLPLSDENSFVGVVVVTFSKRQVDPDKKCGELFKQ